MNPLKTSTFLLLCLLVAGPAVPAAAPPVPRDRYTLELEARPSAVFPFLDKLGRIQILVYPEGVRADSLWLDGYLKAGSDQVRIENPALRLYTDSSYGALRTMFRSLAPEEKTAKFGDLPVRDTGRRGKIKNLPVQCHRIVLGKEAWIDVWTTEALKKSQPYHDLEMQILTTISPDLARAAAKIPGTRLHVVLNTKNHPETTLLATKEYLKSSAGHQEALQTGRFFLRAPSIDRIMR